MMRPSMLGGFFGVALLKGLVFAGTIFLSQIIIRFYGAEALGQFSAAMAAVLLLGIVFRGGLPVLLLRKRVEFPDIRAEDLFGVLSGQLIAQKGRWMLILAALATLLLYLWSVTEPSTLFYFLLMLPLVFLTGWLQLKANYFKVIGRPKQAAVSDMGLVNVALVVAIALFAAVSGGVSLMIVLIWFGVATFVVSGVLIARRTMHPSDIDHTDLLDGQGKLLLNALLTFIYRNGYPLIFAVFASAEHIGKFRLEERLAFAITFVFLVFETLFMKRLVKAVSAQSRAELIGAYRRFALRILVPTALASVTLAYLISWPDIRAALEVADEGRLQSLIFLATPFYVAILFNTLILNLRGKYGSITLNMALISLIFSFSAALFYQVMGLDGLRTSYMFTAICGALISTFVTLKALGDVKQDV